MLYSCSSMDRKTFVVSFLVWPLVILICRLNTVSAFTSICPHPRYDVTKLSNRFGKMPTLGRNVFVTRASGADDEELRVRQEEARMKVLASRRKTIRSALKSAESLKNFRLANGTFFIRTYLSFLDTLSK